MPSSSLWKSNDFWQPTSLSLPDHRGLPDHQVLVVHQCPKKRLVIDYSTTINRFTLLDAYPLPNIDELLSNVAQARYYSSLDFRSAFHQIPLLEEERYYTTFEAGGELYQYKRLLKREVNFTRF